MFSGTPHLVYEHAHLLIYMILYDIYSIYRYSSLRVAFLPFKWHMLHGAWAFQEHACDMAKYNMAPAV